MKSIFLCGGAREKALRHILENGQDIAAVITPRLSSANRRFEKVVYTAVEFGIPVYPVQKDNLQQVLTSIDFDILISCGFPYRIPGEFIKKARYALNVHPTLLPRYKGYRSGPYIIINGEKESGTTIHLLTEELDSGDILAQQAFPLTAFDTTKSVYNKNKDIEGPLLLMVLRDLKNGYIHPVPQDQSRASVYSYVRTPKDSLIDWNKSLKDLYNEIRACDPDEYPAFFFVEGQKVCIKLWRPDKPDEEEDMI